jgi:DNA-binding transcriptional LysR family regulator
MRSSSISGAAKLLHISQPSVSRLIADLEESLGFKLFTRTGHGLVSTIEARRFQQSVESMFIGLDKLRDTAEAILTTRDETIRLSIIPILAFAAIPEAIQSLRDERADLQFDISVQNTSTIVDAVLLQQVDLGVISPMQSYEGIHTMFRTELPYLCLLPLGHRLAATGNSVDLRKMTDEEFVILHPDSFEQPGMNEKLIQGLRSRARIVARSDLAIAAIARSTGLPTLVDPYSARIAVALGGVIARPLRQKMTYPIAIISRSAETLSLASNLFANTLRHQFESSREQNYSNTG